MSRIRTIKPDYWTHEAVMGISRDARLLYVGMWNFCDDGGNHPASHITVKAEVFPGDNLDIETIQFWVEELLSKRLLSAYEVNGKCYWNVTDWKLHQKIDKPSFKYPQALKIPLESYDYGPFDEHSTNGSRTLGGRHPAEGS